MIRGIGIFYGLSRYIAGRRSANLHLSTKRRPLAYATFSVAGGRAGVASPTWTSERFKRHSLQLILFSANPRGRRKMGGHLNLFAWELIKAHGPPQMAKSRSPHGQINPTNSLYARVACSAMWRYQKLSHNLASCNKMRRMFRAFLHIWKVCCTWKLKSGCNADPLGFLFQLLCFNALIHWYLLLLQLYNEI